MIFVNRSCPMIRMAAPGEPLARRPGDGGKRLGRFADPDCTLSKNFQQQISDPAFPPKPALLKATVSVHRTGSVR
ncbi:hypothetical protein PJK45_12225 [Mycobacterium kansasii]|nr:hypothetical protein [Mycobacterium kansasii]MXO36007.1 hypothetical protein [Mycobacterium kansasii]UCA21550.1 hypothetical protein LA359_09835 [Mycobacterium kansasii]UGT81595.1 hypothetical protein LTS70_01920 [Mycobacterium kansasii]UGT85873.1 hypothetical protein LTT71_23575 [Mycobacterium kansasii]UGU25889.1 hypothetical protein LT351_03920 [Mycobacterium kansasii]